MPHPASAATPNPDRSPRTSQVTFRATGADSGTLAQQAIREANQNLEHSTQDQLRAAIAVLLEQRDAALTHWASAQAAIEAERAHLTQEHDRFVAYLMEEQDRKLEALQAQVRTAQTALERQRALNATPGALVPNAATAAGAATDAAMVEREQQQREQVQDLRRLLEAAYSDLEEVKAVVAQVEEERDDALRAIDDTRLELYGELERARDEASLLQTQLDDVNQQLDEAREDARADALRWSERLDETQRELDERRQEVERMRSRMDALTQEVKFSRPPPPTSSDELARVRDELQNVRRELIESKRELSVLSREHKQLRNQRTGGLRAVTHPGVNHPAARREPVATQVPALPIAVAVPRQRAITPVGLGFSEGAAEPGAASSDLAPDTVSDLTRTAAGSATPVAQWPHNVNNTQEAAAQFETLTDPDFTLHDKH